MVEEEEDRRVVAPPVKVVVPVVPVTGDRRKRAHWNRQVVLSDHTIPTTSDNDVYTAYDKDNAPQHRTVEIIDPAVLQLGPPILENPQRVVRLTDTEPRNRLYATEDAPCDPPRVPAHEHQRTVVLLNADDDLEQQKLADDIELDHAAAALARFRIDRAADDREALVAYARYRTKDQTNDIGENGLVEAMIRDWRDPEFPYVVAAEWDHVEGKPWLGRGDLVFANRPLHAPGESRSVLVVEVKFIGTHNSATTHIKKLVKVWQQERASGEAWRRRHPDDIVHTRTFTNATGGASGYYIICRRSANDDGLEIE